jgi:hypothetical protein
MKFLDVLRRLLFRSPKHNGCAVFSNAVNTQIMFFHKKGIRPNKIAVHRSPIGVGHKKTRHVCGGLFFALCG